MPLHLAIAVIIALASSVASATAAPLEGAIVLDPDIIWDVANPDAFALSPDGTQIAYISKGAIWCCDVAAGPPVKLADVANSVTDILAQSGNEAKREQSASMPFTSGYEPFAGPMHLDVRHIVSLAWTPQQDGVVFVVQSREEKAMVASHRIVHASTSGAVTEIANIEGQFGVPREHSYSFHVTPDLKHVIVSSYNATLIWNVETRFPQASCYEYLVPSPTSGNFLGVEIDTRQLVLVDDEFKITKRFETTFTSGRRLALAWSADERIAVCCEYREYDSRQWDGFRIDLDTGVQGPPFSGVLADRFIFSPSGKVVRLGLESTRAGGYADGSDGAFIAVASVDAEERFIHRFSGISRAPKVWRDRKTYPQAISNAEGTLFVMAIPRPNHRQAGFHFHVVDSTGWLTPLVPDNDDAYITPYLPIAFADQDRVLIARSGSTLFSIPVSRLAAQGDDDDE
jgi:hypothetical protein